ncbi:MAG: hypothetical protein ACJ76Y_06295 [Thermoanaerobaculia bacterium]
MAETRRVSSARPSPARRRTGPRPPLPHPPRHNPPSRPPSEETIDLGPAAREETLAPPSPPALPAARPAPPPPRTGPERAVLALLLAGLALNALALLRPAALSPADELLGATVLLAGVALLVVMELYRRAGR